MVPAAHYTCGGVLTDLDGRTDVPGLYAIGETACTGLHGANRLASNSLLECVVFAARRRRGHPSQHPGSPRPRCRPGTTAASPTPTSTVVISHNWDELRRFMWDYVGIVRTNKRLERAAHRIALLQGEIAGVLRATSASRATCSSCATWCRCAELIVRSAQARRRKPRALHFSRDYPALAAPAAPTILVPPAL